MQLLQASRHHSNRIVSALPPFPHGRRLTPEEYERAVIRLYREAGGTGASDEERTKLRRAELDLQIDHRLGVDFPRARREEMWRVQEQAERRRLRILARSLLVRFLPRSLAVSRLSSLYDMLISEYSQVLTAEEIRDFLGLQSSE